MVKYVLIIMALVPFVCPMSTPAMPAIAPCRGTRCEAMSRALYASLAGVPSVSLAWLSSSTSIPVRPDSDRSGSGGEGGERAVRRRTASPFSTTTSDDCPTALRPYTSGHLSFTREPRCEQP